MVCDGVFSINMIVWLDVDWIDLCLLWQDVCDFGLLVGVVQLSWVVCGVFGLLSIVCYVDWLMLVEINMLMLQINWFVNLLYLLMSCFMVLKLLLVVGVMLIVCECEVLCWMVEGKIVCEIGQIFSILEWMVNFYVNNIFEKFGVINKVQVVVKVILVGFIEVF